MNDVKTQTTDIEVIGEIYECDFVNEAFTVVSFSVPNETRWFNGKYKIIRINDEVKP